MTTTPPAASRPPLIDRLLADWLARRACRRAVRAHHAAMLRDLRETTRSLRATVAHLRAEEADTRARIAELADLAATCPPARVNPDGSPA